MLRRSYNVSQVEKHLIDGLKAKFPDHQFIGEESSNVSFKVLWKQKTRPVDR